MGDFNINLLNFESHTHTDEFINGSLLLSTAYNSTNQNY